MSDLLRWADLTRTRLTELLPGAVVAMAIGATEQHGPHLATGTDALLATTVLERAAERYATFPVGPGSPDRPLILAPTMPFGASDHHLAFGGTISLRAETLLAALVDICTSLSAVGAKRLVIVNGHGGNTGVCHAAAGAAAARTGLVVAHVDYWSLLGTDTSPLEPRAVPGHAGVFETSLVSAVRPDLVTDPPTRPDPTDTVEVAGLTVQAARIWSDRDGYTDSPADGSATTGRLLLDRLADALATRLGAFAATA
jgi:creatinine amidohydrolase